MLDNQSSSLWQVEDAGPQHIVQIRALFESVFKEEMSQDLWDWKYADGRGVGVVVLHDDEIVSFFGGTERRVLFNNQSVCAVQCGDSMVAPAHRGTLSKKGPFYLSVCSFLSKYVGSGLPYLLSYGFPNARAMRLAQRLGMYDEVGTLLEVSWSARQSDNYHSCSLELGFPAHQQHLDSLWGKMAAAFKDRAIGVRDLAYLKQRYHDHPSLDYDIHLVSLAMESEPLGIIVTRNTGDRLLLVDVVASPDNIRHLVQYGRQLAMTLKCQDIHGWLTEVDRQLIADTDVSVVDPPLKLPLGVYSPGLTASDVKDKWFFMCGDSDFL